MENRPKLTFFEWDSIVKKYQSGGEIKNILLKPESVIWEIEYDYENEFEVFEEFVGLSFYQEIRFGFKKHLCPLNLNRKWVCCVDYGFGRVRIYGLELGIQPFYLRKNFTLACKQIKMSSQAHKEFSVGNMGKDEYFKNKPEMNDYNESRKHRRITKDQMDILDSIQQRKLEAEIQTKADNELVEMDFQLQQELEYVR